MSCYFGGLPVDRDLDEIADKSRTPHIIIGTPGRLLDLIYRKAFHLNNVILKSYLDSLFCDRRMRRNLFKRCNRRWGDLSTALKNAKNSATNNGKCNIE